LRRHAAAIFRQPLDFSDYAAFHAAAADYYFRAPFAMPSAPCRCAAAAAASAMPVFAAAYAPFDAMPPVFSAFAHDYLFHYFRRFAADF